MVVFERFGEFDAGHARGRGGGCGGGGGRGGVRDGAKEVVVVYGIVFIEKVVFDC